MFARIFGGAGGGQTNSKHTKKNKTIDQENGFADDDGHHYDSEPELDDQMQEALDNTSISSQDADNVLHGTSKKSKKNTRKASSSTQKSNQTSKTSSSQDSELKSIMADNPLLPEEMCEIPTFLETKCCDNHLIEETRRLLRKKYAKRPESMSQVDYERMLNDDWTVSRFLLRCRLEPGRAAKLMEQCGKFRLEYKMSTSKLSDFPIEFHRAGGLFRYAPDRVGNETLYMRVKMHRRTPELSKIMKSFILCVLEECDRANNGRGTAVIFDLSGCGIPNADPGFLFWLVYSFRNYCPKGLSYIIVYNLPWILNATARLALSWLSSNNKKRLRFVSGEGIKDFIAVENLPDYLGGTCKINYRKVPPGSLAAEETAHENGLTKEEARKIKEIYGKFLKSVDDDIEFDDTNEDCVGHIDTTTKLNSANAKEAEANGQIATLKKTAA